jgi:hypothetical protein
MADQLVDAYQRSDAVSDIDDVLDDLQSLEATVRTAKWCSLWAHEIQHAQVETMQFDWFLSQAERKQATSEAMVAQEASTCAVAATRAELLINSIKVLGANKST